MAAYVFQEYPKWLYHQKLAPKGRLFNSATETDSLHYQGWVESPAKFAKSSKIVLWLKVIKPWWSEWEWAFKALAVLLAVAAAAITLSNVL